MVINSTICKTRRALLIMEAAGKSEKSHPVRGGTSSDCASESIFRFQSTHPVRGGTVCLHFILGRVYISIHPPRAGWDRTSPIKLGSFSATHFNPPTPCGVGLSPDMMRWRCAEFQSTHPVRGGTKERTDCILLVLYFNPPTPCGVGLWCRTSLFRL